VALGPGMSVVPTVRVQPEPSLYERLPSLDVPLAMLRGWLTSRYHQSTGPA
jgi:hypothetical protein